ncbi:MAG: lipoprotein-releasing ABC transporter permease subunit [Caulobacter sp.]|nr:lipoprotein-releasing ABC transporter permease subunit [Caulobacter sp.]
MTKPAGSVAPPFGLWERAVAGRYLRAKRKHGGVALISLISFIGITLAVTVLIVVMSVMNGFRTELLDRILGFNGHAYVTGAPLSSPDRAAIVGRLKAVPGVRQVIPAVEGQAMVLGPSQIAGAIVRGVSPADLRATTLVSSNIKPGSAEGFGQGEYGGELILVGERLAASLGVAPGDSVALISPAGAATAFGTSVTQKDYTVGGIFSVGMSEYDQAFIYMPLQQAQLFFGRDDTIDAIEIMLDDPDAINTIKPMLAAAAGPGAIVTDWTQKNQSFFEALQVERAAMRLILMFIVAIAAMNIISGLVMLVKNKGRDIGILRTMGAGQGAILRIFFMSGAAVGVAGTAAGLLLGVVICTNIEAIQKAVEWVTGANVFNADVYFLTHVPAKIEWREVGIITGWSLFMSFVATLPPAWRASRIDPVEALRYE